MQREEFVQQLWLDYVHQHPEVAALRVWPLDAPVEYLALVTLNHGPWRMDALLPSLLHLGYRPGHRHAMADRGLLATLLSPPDDGPWLVLGELQLGTLSREPRQRLDFSICSNRRFPTHRERGGESEKGSQCCAV